MRNLLSYTLTSKRIHIYVLLTFGLATHIFFYLWYGVRTLYDSNGYLEGADFIIKHGTIQDIHHIFYIVPIGLIAFFKKVFDSDCVAFLVFQSGISLFATLTLYYASERIHGSKPAAFITSLIFVFWLENRHWDMTVMTESLMASLICFIIHELTNLKKNTIIIIVCLVAMIFTRPTSFIIVTASILYILTVRWSDGGISSIMKGLFIVCIPIFIIVVTYLMFLHWDFSEQYARGNVVTYMDVTKGKSYYSEFLHLQTKDLTIPPYNVHPMFKIGMFILYNPVFFLKLAALKLFFLLFYVRPYYSMTHNVFTFCWVTFIYVSAWLGLKNLRDIPFRNFALTAIVFNCLLIAISSVDWDNRFYIPMETSVVILAGGGLGVCLNRRIQST